jgi:hypothetical protein
MQTLQTALGVFIGTLPVLGVILWNLIEVKGIRTELREIRAELARHGERLATLEERDRWEHHVVQSQ